MNNPTTLIQKLLNYCNILHDDGMSCGDHVEQSRFLLFLKMADEHSRPPFNKRFTAPKALRSAQTASVFGKAGTPEGGQIN